MKLIDYIGLIMTGLLSLLWWDIRGIRNERQKEEKQGRDMREKDLGMIHDTFLKKDDHTVLCRLATAEIKEEVRNIVDGAVTVLKDEIRNNKT